MVAGPQTPIEPTPPTPIGASAADNLRYIRNTIAAANTFTTIPGKGCIAMGIAGLLAALLETLPGLAPHWLPIWLTSAVVSCTVALFFMEKKARRQGMSLLTAAVAQRFFLTLAPAFVAGAILTVALRDQIGRDMIAGIWVLLYGVGVATCGVFSIPIVLIAGLGFMGLGTVMLAAPPDWTTAMLALGFGGIHIALGVVIARDHGG